MYDVEKWIGKEIELLSSPKYKDIYDVFDKTGWLVGVGGAKCTKVLKRDVRKAYQKEGDLHLFGMTADEGDRIDDFEDNNPDLSVEWILRERDIKKADCYRIVQRAGIELPMMYRLGYNNANCVGCVKGGAGYWNKIRRDFPSVFDKMARQERKMDVAILATHTGGVRKRVFLDMLDPSAGRDVPFPDIECGVVCIRPRVDASLDGVRAVDD